MFKIECLRLEICFDKIEVLRPKHTKVATLILTNCPIDVELTLSNWCNRLW